MTQSLPFPLHPMATAPRVAAPQVLLALHESVVHGQVDKAWRLISWETDADGHRGWRMADSGRPANPTAWVCVMPSLSVDLTDVTALQA